MILYPTFYRQHGIRRSNQLLSPVISPVEFLTVPTAGVIHSNSHEDKTLCVSQDDFLLRHVSGTIFIENHTELASGLGHPRRMFTSTTRLLSSFYRGNRRMRPLTDRTRQLHNSKSVLVENYDLLPHFWRYNATQQFRLWNEWANTQATVWQTVKEICNDLPERQQFIVMKLPQVFPTWMQLQRSEKKLTSSTLKMFNEPESLFILDLFRWMGEHRDESLIKLDEKELNNINLIWIESGHWVMINMGYLENWRKGKPEEPEEGEEVVEGDGRNANSVTPQNLQKRFLRMLMFLYELRTVMGTTPVSENAPVATADNDNATPPNPDVHDSLITKIGGALGLVAQKEKEVDPGALATPKTDVINEKVPLSEPLHVAAAPGAVVTKAAIDEAVSSDLEALDKIIHSEVDEADVPDEEVQTVVDAVREIIPTYTPREVTLEEGILKRADQLAKMGRMSGAEYRRAQRLATAYKSLPDPRGGEQTLVEQAKIDLKIMPLTNLPKVPDLPEVFDKSMLHSSVHEFDSKYIEHVLPKDITNAVLNVQKAGIAVTRYNVERKTNAGNDYEEHTVRLEPLHGNRSTIKFRVPVVKPNGTFLAGGVKYRQRKQRSEIPIRKVNSTLVSLSSYYGKVYINRGQKVVNNYQNWLVARMLASPIITHSLISDVMVSDVQLPKDYTTVATKFRSFDAKGYHFIWDYTKRSELLAGTRSMVRTFEEYEDGGVHSVLVGRGNNRDNAHDTISMDIDSGLLVLRKSGSSARTSLGTIQEFLEIDAKKVPLEVAEIEISGKTMPVAIVLCYLMGFHGLLKQLDTPYRSQPASQRLNLEKGEFAVRFEDETFIFNRRHVVASMIMGGLNSYDTTLRNYAASSLDLKDTYFNILDDEGLGVRFLREIDLLNDLFIDPITLEILKELNDPVDFIGLVLKAVDLLKTDWSPEETDMAYMRIKGYERVAGAVYNELVRSIRLQRARPGMVGSVIEMPPYAVWQSITQDPAVSLVEESNPVHNLKEKEEVTYSGTGGRSSRSMVKRTRVFHPNDMGVISEATKDSSDVAITTFMTADPNLLNLRGMTRRWNKEDDGAAKVFSTSALLAPAADRDD